jgi:hypothetical protein
MLVVSLDGLAPGNERCGDGSVTITLVDMPEVLKPESEPLRFSSFSFGRRFGGSSGSSPIAKPSNITGRV